MLKNLLALLLISISHFSFSQKLEVEKKAMKNEEGITVDSWVAHVDQDVAYSATTLAEFLKKTFNAKAEKKNKNMMLVSKTTFSEISNLRLDMRAMFALESGGTAIAFMFSPGYDLHFGEEFRREEFAKAEEFVKNYLRFHYKYFYDDQTKKIQNKLKDVQGDILSNDKKIERNNTSMRDYETKMTAEGADVDKLREKKSKLEKENENIANNTVKKKEEITKLEDDLVKISDAIKNVSDYK